MISDSVSEQLPVIEHRETPAPEPTDAVGMICRKFAQYLLEQHAATLIDLHNLRLDTAEADQVCPEGAD